ncbi:7-cyano-7-deazaguanine synthase QueC [Candidatus Deianiraea vastatrix]|uniref:7-cyano-7-deazaguanine synthase n=1 Tax=Candidatus Deianiraea vastatrix TaxID=2163644 RepID=A0A5B8XEG9_9RICK|nr:7-cyano-7-deazaguanine synthase QueC [Candidatus Deianiraea vastatrix]QED23739.1 7-cyano-7-deazaguanine synthase [Candidatus Deianiraea vastatrix]
MKKCVLLLSGGLDSVTTLALVNSQKYDVYAISFLYGQKHSIELEYAKHNAEVFKVKHKIFDMRSAFSDFNSSLLGVGEISKTGVIDDGIPNTYVPARNIIFLSIALGYAESINAKEIFIGANAIDYSGYPDCRPEFIESFQKMANIGTTFSNGELKIQTPLIAMKKSEIIKLGLSLGVDYSKTISCYSPENGKECGKCDSCIIRKKGFEEAEN